MELTNSFEALLQSFAPAFTTPSFVTFRLLMTGWILSTRHRYVTDLIVSSDSVGDGHFSDYHRFFSQAAWKIDDLWRLLSTGAESTGRYLDVAEYPSRMHEDRESRTASAPFLRLLPLEPRIPPTMKTLVGTCLCLAALASVSQAATPPNFVIFYVDDLGWADSSVHMMDDEPLSASDVYQTPALERLAKQGVRFTSSSAPTPTCTGSRIAIQFGMTSARLQYRNVFDVLSKQQFPAHGTAWTQTGRRGNLGKPTENEDESLSHRFCDIRSPAV
ncbi:MAG: hypothetical protein ACI8P0_000676, partial [Planctomycetaceae bacterium]